MPRWTLLALLGFTLLAVPTAHADDIVGSFTAIGTPMPWPGWDETGRVCNVGIDGVHKTSRTFTAPFDGLLTLSASGFAGDWDLFVEDVDGRELAGSNRFQRTGSLSGDEQLVTLLARDASVRMIACNNTGEPLIEVGYRFEAFDPGRIGATVAVGDDGGGVNYFRAREVTVAAGEAVGWSMDAGSFPHTVTADDGSFRGGTVIGGTTVWVFDEPGEYLYYCEFHGLPGGNPTFQTGKVIVTAA